MRDRPVLSEGVGESLPEGRVVARRPVILTGGFPCQDLSVAGRQAGLTGERSGLWKEYLRVIGDVLPEWVVIENVAHTWRRWVPVVRSDLSGRGYASLPLRVRASDLGAPHERARIFLIANADGELLRKLSRWWCGAGREMARQFAEHGEEQPLADANGLRELQPEGCEQEIGGRVGDRGWWATEPDVGRVAHGIPARVDRLTALGNAIVPQIAQLIAEGIKEVSK